MYRKMEEIFTFQRLSSLRWQVPQLPWYKICDCSEQARDHKGHHLRRHNASHAQSKWAAKIHLKPVSCWKFIEKGLVATP